MKLNKLTKNELEKKTMLVLKGGRCGCEGDCYPATSISFTGISKSYNEDGY